MAVQADIELVRDWVGDQPDDSVIEAFLGRLISVEAAALAILRRRRAALAYPSTEQTVVSEFSVAGDASWKTGATTLSAQTAALDTLIARLEALLEQADPTAGALLPTVTTGRLVRPGTSRSGWC